ncbi:hypothetical protein DSL64_06780 [Dyadobacter luteus]|jgi:hypothetical protein|uniref:Lipoprotein n=1 Tax=Dyadobacter luteus TaxID=2259619 RepID=A0A3D8YEG9_9BACT|nr:hypothetical protein [Dyadobacter luteus]REA62625.1 hypothetical protein DSL64_06780 [Dyadobacter luteus]
MKISTSSFLLIVLLTGCNKIEPAKPTACSDPQFGGGTRSRYLDNVKTYVFAHTGTRADSSKVISYFIRNPDSDSELSQVYIPCNLPEEYQKDQLSIRFSGYTLYFPGDEYRNSICSIVEITSIKAR